MSGSSWRSLRTAAGAIVLGAVLWRTGTGPFVDGFRSLDLGTLALGAALAVPATVACAWRWQLVARGLGLGVALGPAVASCYRAQFLNTTLPGGVLGDVHRGVRHGLAAGDPGLGLRAVAWERFAGQVVFAVLAAVVLSFSRRRCDRRCRPCSASWHSGWWRLYWRLGTLPDPARPR